MIREGAEFRELMLQVFRTRMAFRRSMQRTLRKNNAGITFEMLQVLSCLWHEQGISQQILAERIAKDKACLTNPMNNLEKKGLSLIHIYSYSFIIGLGQCVDVEAGSGKAVGSAIRTGQKAQSSYRFPVFAKCQLLVVSRRVGHNLVFLTMIYREFPTDIFKNGTVTCSIRNR